MVGKSLATSKRRFTAVTDYQHDSEKGGLFEDILK